MNCQRIPIAIVAFFAGVVSSVLLFGQLGELTSQAAGAHAQDVESKHGVDLAALQADVQRLKTVSESAGMRDVDEYATNLWFSVRSQNWPLADYYWKKTLFHMHLAVQIGHFDKDVAGEQASMEKVLKAVEKSQNMQVAEAIRKHDLTKFQTAYHNLLQGCYDCHKAADKPFLRPRMPLPPAASIIDFDPKATWPK